MSENIVQPNAENTPNVEAPATNTTAVTTPESKPAASVQPNTVVGPDRDIAGLRAELIRERKSRQEFEKRFNTLSQEHQTREQRLSQIFGGQKYPEEQEFEAVRQAIGRMYPALEKLTPEAFEKIQSLLENSEALQQSAKAVWDMRAVGARERLFSQVQDALGSEKLSERQQLRLLDGLIGWLDSNQQIREQYEAGDNTPIEVFVKEFVEDWIEPAKRRGIQSEVDKARKVPSGGNRSIPGRDKKPLNFTDNKAVEDALVDAFKSQGGKFDR